MKLLKLIAAIVLTGWMQFILACVSPDLPVEETAREVLSVRLMGFVVVLGLALIFVVRNLRKK